jgi:hypothetical protein
MNTVKDGYIWTVDWVEDHPHVAFWVIAGLLLAVVIF